MAALARLLPLILLLGMTASLASAQEGPPGRWWRTPRVVEQLQLTDGEIQKLEHAFEASRLKMIKLKGQVEAEQFKLQSMVERPDMKEKTLKAQNRKLEKARSALADERFAFFVEVRKTIGHQRFQKLLAMYPSGR